MSDPIDQLVKGAPPSHVSQEQVAANAKASSPSPSNPSRSVTAPVPPTGSSTDPRDALPSSPLQIHLNLLVLESSLHQQYFSLRARQERYSLLLAILIAWNSVFTYLLFFRPREDGSGVGGSVYWILEAAEKGCWCSGAVTLVLFFGSGMYDRGIRWPRKFVSTANRGLRGFNLKLVVVKGSFLSELVGWIAMLDQMGWFRKDRINFQWIPKGIDSGSSNDYWDDHEANDKLIEENIAPGGDILRLLLLPKPFSPDFREGWDTFQTEYWESENARRASLRTIVRARKRKVAKRDGGWLWWTGWRGWNNVGLGLWKSRKPRRQLELERLALDQRPYTEKGKERRRKDGLFRDGSHSRNSSLSRTSTPDPDRQAKRERRTSSAHSANNAGVRRPRKPPVNEKSRLSATETLLYDSSVLAPMSKRDSTVSTGSSEDGVKKEEDIEPQISEEPMFTDRIKAEPEEA